MNEDWMNAVDPLTGLPMWTNGNMSSQQPSLQSFWSQTPNTNQFGSTSLLNPQNQSTSLFSNLTGGDNMATPDASSFWSNASQGIGAIGSLADSYLGYRQLGQAQDQLAFQREAFWTNYNQQMADREEAARRRRIAAQ